MKEKRKFSGEFITEMESLQVLGGTALNPQSTDNCHGGHCGNCAECYCLPANRTLFCPGPCVSNPYLGCYKSKQ